MVHRLAEDPSPPADPLPSLGCHVVHNPTWVPGHLHLTVGAAVTLTFMGILYWLLPVLTGKGLWMPGKAEH